MATLAANEPRTYEGGERNEHPVIAADIIYEGAASGDNGSGYARPLVAGDPFLGFAEAKADNSDGAAGDINCRFIEKGKAVLPVVGASALTDRLAKVYASDDNTFTLTAGSNTLIGVVHRWVAGTTCVVYFDVDSVELAGDAVLDSQIFPKIVATTEATAGNETLSAAELIGGLILRDPNGADRTDTTDTAALILAAIPGAIVGSSFEFTIRNTADAAETITIAGGTGVTTSGTMTIAQNNSKRFLLVFTNVTAASEAATLYSLGTVVH